MLIIENNNIAWTTISDMLQTCIQDHKIETENQYQNSRLRVVPSETELNVNQSAA